MMIPEYSYHELESLIPPTTEVDRSNKHSFLRLETLCVLKIVKNRKKNNLLSKTPAHLHKVVWRAYLNKKYYEQYIDYNYARNFHFDFRFDELPDLMHAWPYEEFVLKDVIPSSFPPMLESYSEVRCYRKDGSLPDPYVQNKEKSSNFISELFDTIINIITKGCSHPMTEEDAIVASFFLDSESSNSSDTESNHSNDTEIEEYESYCKIIKINISGYKKAHNILKDIEIEKPFLFNETGKLEIICDICIDINKSLYHKIVAGTNKITTNTYVNSFDSIFLKFNHISISVSYKGKRDVILNFIEGLWINGPISINLHRYLDDGFHVYEKLFVRNAPQDHIQAVGLNKVYSLVFLKYLNNLIHLDISMNNLHGKLDALGHMNRGLVYLNLSEGELTDEDLVHLVNSNHQSTLKELHLGVNKFNIVESNSNLVELCKSLKNTVHLNLRYCGLENLPIEVMTLLFHSLNSMPNITYLNLFDNDFDVAIVKNLFMILKENLSLRYISVELPASIIYLDFIEEIHEMINEKRSQLCFVAFEKYIPSPCDVM